MSKEHIQLLIKHKKEELQLLEAQLQRLEIAGDNSTPEDKPIYKFYSTATRGKRRNYNRKARVVRSGSTYVHLEDCITGAAVKRTEKYLRDISIDERA